MRPSRVASLCGILALAAPAVAQTPGFWLVGAPAGTDRSRVFGLSQTGAVAAGFGETSSGAGGLPGFTWTSAGGRTDFGLDPGMPGGTPGYGLSSDGNTLVGFMGGPGTDRAYRRIGNGPLQDLGPFYSYTRARAVSGDGSVVAGRGFSISSGIWFGEAFRWTAQTGIQGLGTLSGDGLSTANGISRDGSTIVGESGFTVDRAFVWRQETGMQALPALPGASTAFSSADAASADGGFIVGRGNIVGGATHALRWTAAGAQDLGTLPDHTNSAAFSVSDDGSIVGGGADSAAGPLAFVWSASTGMTSLPDLLTSYGVTVPAGWRPAYIYAVSGDGLTFAGEAWSTTGTVQGFVATIPSPSGPVALLISALLFGRRRAR